MFKKTLLLALIFSLFLSSFGLVGANILCPRTQSNLSWPVSPLGTAITEPYSSAVCRPGYYFRTGVDTPRLIQYFYEWIIVLGGLAVFIAFIWAGLLYMTSVGDSNKMSEAKKKIKNALTGLVLLLSSWLIFHTINPHLTRLRGGIGEVELAALSPENQTRITNFIKAYTQCLTTAKMRKHGEITVPIPILRLTFNPFPDNSEIRIGDPPSPYNSFLGGAPITHCERFVIGISPIIVSNFRSRVINQRTVSFPRLVEEVECVQGTDGIWNPIGYPFENDPSIPRVERRCPQDPGHVEPRKAQITRYLVIDRTIIRNYGELIKRLNLPPFPDLAPTRPDNGPAQQDFERVRNVPSDGDTRGRNCIAVCRDHPTHRSCVSIGLDINANNGEYWDVDGGCERRSGGNCDLDMIDASVGFVLNCGTAPNRHQAMWTYCRCVR